MNIEPANTTRSRERLIPNPKLKLREQFHEVMRFKHFSQRTEEAYWSWVMRFLRFHRVAPHPASGHLLPRAEKEKGSVLTADKTVAIARRVRRKISGGEKKLRVKGWELVKGSVLVSF